MQFLIGSLLVLSSIFLILLILVQRGRGGGLAGALSGMGGQSAFGTKAGDTFTRITIVAASAWLLICMLAIAVLNGGGSIVDQSKTAANTTKKTDKQDDDKKETGAVGLEAPKSDQDATKDTVAPSDSTSGSADKPAESSTTPPASTSDSSSTPAEKPAEKAPAEKSSDEK